MNIESLKQLEPYQVHFIRRLLKAPLKDLNTIINQSHDAIESAFGDTDFDVVKFIQDYVDEFKALSIERIFDAIETENEFKKLLTSNKHRNCCEKAYALTVKSKVSNSIDKTLEKERNLLESSFELPAFEMSTITAEDYLYDRLRIKYAKCKPEQNNLLKAIVEDILAVELLNEFSYKEIASKIRQVHPTVKINTVVLGSLIKNDLGYRIKRIRRKGYKNYINVYFK